MERCKCGPSVRREIPRIAVYGVAECGVHLSEDVIFLKEYPLYIILYNIENNIDFSLLRLDTEYVVPCCTRRVDIIRV